MRTSALRRFTARGGDPLLEEHHRDSLSQAGGLEGIARVYDELMAFLATRPQTAGIPTRQGRPDDALAAVLSAVGVVEG